MSVKPLASIRSTAVTQKPFGSQLVGFNNPVRTLMPGLDHAQPPESAIVMPLSHVDYAARADASGSHLRLCCHYGETAQDEVIHGEHRSTQGSPGLAHKIDSDPSVTDIRAWESRRLGLVCDRYGLLWEGFRKPLPLSVSLSSTIVNQTQRQYASVTT